MSEVIIPSYVSNDEQRVDLEVAATQDGGTEASITLSLSVGQQLRLAREAKGLTLADVARSLKLSTRQVEALEAEDWPNLPGKTIIRGFVRNEARLLGLNPDVLMSALDTLNMPLAPELEMTTGASVSIPQESSADRRDYVRVFSGLIILSLAIAAFFFFPADLWQTTLSALKAASQPNEVVVVNEPASSVDKANTPEVAIATAPPKTLVPPDVAAIPESSASSLSPTASSTTLRFGFTKPAWVEVRDRSGQIIFSKLSQSGSQQDIEGQPPFALIVGNATYVTLEYKGKPVELSNRSKDDVSRLTLE